MNLKELNEINELVTNEAQARRASLIKWGQIRGRLAEVWSWIDRCCGFCSLAVYRSENGGIRGKCVNCPESVRDECREIQGRSSELMDGFDSLIDETMIFLRDFKVSDGSDEVETDA